jgi:hypothetical protein
MRGNQMNPLGTWIIRLLGGFFPFITKGFGEWFGKILFYAIISLLAMSVYNKVFPTKPTTSIEKIETQIVNQCPQENKYFGIGINLWKLKLGVGI